MKRKIFIGIILAISLLAMGGGFQNKALAITCQSGSCTPHTTSYPIYSPSNNYSYTSSSHTSQSPSSHTSSYNTSNTSLSTCTSASCTSHTISYPIYSPTTTKPSTCTTCTPHPTSYPVYSTTTTTTKPPTTTTSTTTTTKPSCCPPVIVRPGVYPVYQIQTPTLDFWADKYTIYQGESVYLRWSSSYTHYCVASLGWSGPKSTVGSELVSPITTTTYSLTCYGNNATLTRNLTINVIEPISQQGEISLFKSGRNLSSGERNYAKSVLVRHSEIVEFYISITNPSSSPLYNVFLKDDLPAAFSYRPGTTKVNGIAFSDGITTNGISLGTLNPHQTTIITFQAQALVNYGTYTNTVTVSGSNFTSKSDSMTLSFPQVFDASIVKTGSPEALTLSLVFSSLSSGGLFYFFKNRPEGKDFITKLEEKSRKYLLEKTRRKLLKK